MQAAGCDTLVPMERLSVMGLTEVLQREVPALPVTLVDGRSRDVIAAADCVLTASGTTTTTAVPLSIAI